MKCRRCGHNTEKPRYEPVMPPVSYADKWWETRLPSEGAVFYRKWACDKCGCYHSPEGELYTDPYDPERYAKKPEYRLTFSADQLLTQLHREGSIERILHRKLIEAGYTHDGMDGYTAPLGAKKIDMDRLLDEALDEAHGEKP